MWLGGKIVNIVGVVIVRGGRRYAPSAIGFAANPVIMRKLIKTV